MKHDLKTCPFCGSNDVHVMFAQAENLMISYSVICRSCNTGIFRPNFTENEWTAYVNGDEAINAWNKRPRKVSKNDKDRQQEYGEPV